MSTRPRVAALRAERRAAKVCLWCAGILAANSRTYCVSHLTRKNAMKRQQYERLRDAVYAGYGNRCQCCSEDERAFFTIDHVNGGGTAERRGNTDRFGMFRTIIRDGFPPKYQLLCFNCNCARGFFGACPHEAQRAELVS